MLPFRALSCIVLPYVARPTHKARVYEVRPHQLLVAQEQEACHEENRAQEVLQMVSEVYSA